LDTNVHRFLVAYDDEHDKKNYVDGVGSRGGIIGKLIGGATGAGAGTRIQEQFENLQAAFSQGDYVIDIIGYSRGAAIARLFVHRIEAAFERLRDHEGCPLDKPPAVRFLGLFDTVASFGIPWNDDVDFPKEIPEFVQNTYHAMALDETRETFGIERCLGNRARITEVWFRGGHGDIGGNATYNDRRNGEVANFDRSTIALNWMLSKANACGLPVPKSFNPQRSGNVLAPVTARDEPISIGRAGTLSRRIHVGDLVHYSVEKTELTRGIDGRQLRRIQVPTRIEDEYLEGKDGGLNWVPPAGYVTGPDNLVVSESPSLRSLSTRLYPFDVLPARTWRAWLDRWELLELQAPVIEPARHDEFWSPRDADRALAWDLYVELMTRITVQELKDNEGNSKAALESVYQLFPLSRESMKKHGVECSNAGALITAFLNSKVRWFTAKWHPMASQIDESSPSHDEGKRIEFRDELRGKIRPVLIKLSDALSQLADAKL
jgi:hypothetical protein